MDIWLNGLEILIVEDDATSAILTARLLAKYGAGIETASNGHEALKKFKDHSFPVVIIDIILPDINGLELAHTLKTLDSSIQFIATSANRDTATFVSAIELGFSDYLVKPFEFENLILSVKRCGEVIAARKQLEEEQGKFHAIVESLGEGIAIKNLEFRILYQNQTLTKMLGDFTGLPCYNMFGNVSICENCPTMLTLGDGQPHSACKSTLKNGELFHIESTASLVLNSCGDITGTVTVFHDINERVKNEQIIHNLAFHDQLTGLANRRLFEDRLSQAIAKYHRYGTMFGLLYLDLDHFKMINDRFGHEAGDIVLMETAERIRSCCKRDVDTICRQGGDEFCIIISNCKERKYLEKIAEKLLETVSLPILVGATDISVTTSIGIGMFPSDGATSKSIKAAADAAMYSAKQLGRNTHNFFDARTLTM
jgi:diguanylate cyclase (GGDEF)-like protein